MAIHLHRSNRTEALAGALCRVLAEVRPADPFQELPVVVGSRGMERWLRHEIATRMDIAAGLAFPFPRQALAGATRWLLDGAEEPDARFWEVDPAALREARRWERDALAFQLVGLLRSHAEEAEFAAVARYLGEGRDDAGDGAVTARELLFAAEVGDVLDRLMHDRPDCVLGWTEDPETAEEEHRWLATLLAELGASVDPHAPAVQHREVVAALPIVTGRSMCMFGLSTMGPGDRERLAAISRSIDVHLFVLVPTDHRVIEEGGEDNPILGSLGLPSRDLLAWLEEVGYRGDQLRPEDPVTGDPPALLHRLQGWILRGEGPEAVASPWPLDRSLSVHSTWGALRQCEILRDELLAMFADDPTLEPRDVVVMTPDIETYAPLVAAVFARTGLASGAGKRRLPRIPVSIADLGLRRTNPVAEVLLRILELAGDRLTASQILDFLALEPVREKWSLDDDDLGDIRRLIRDSGLRWGLDAKDRAAVDQPALDQNTVRFALERLALGILMPDEAPLAVVPATSGTLEPAVPVDVESADRVHRVGRLAAILRTLAAHRTTMEQAAPLATWRDRLIAALDELAATADESGWLRSEVDSALDDLARTGALLGELEVDRPAILRWLQGGFEIPQRGDRPITGAVQVCALEPMRSVPFRVVALLGMDDKAFPRGGRPRTWDPMGERRPGERDRREIDRHLMLEAVLSARQRLILLWSGRDVQQGRVQPAAVPVEELLEVVGRLTGHPRGRLVREHALQPWSAGNFGDDPSGFDQGMAQAAVLLREIATGEREPRPAGLAASGASPLPAETLPPQTLDVRDLAGALLAPHRLLLRDRLGLSVSAGDAAIEDREPLELDSLEAWSLRARLVKHLVEEGWDRTDAALAEALRVRVAGEGLLPMRAGGRAILGVQAEKARGVLTNLRAIDGEAADGLELSVGLDGGLLLIGRVDDVIRRHDELLLQWHTPSAGPNERLRLLAWLHLLAAVAAGHQVAGARLVGYRSQGSSRRAGGDFLTFAGTGNDARAALEDLIRVWRSARRQPIPLFRRTSSAAAETLARVGDDLGARGARTLLAAAVAEGWSGGFNAQGDVDDPWIRTFFVDYDPIDQLDEPGELGLLGLARRVWLPVVRGLDRGRDLGAAWLRRADR